jgi:VWFA-related protein
MKRLSLSVFAAFLAALSAYAQQPTPSPKPSPKPTEEQVVRINTDLIQIDVTVLDKDGKVVTGLKPKDFELFENRQLQKITNFSFVSKLAGGSTVNSDTPNQAATTSNPVPIERSDVRRTIALVVDDLNLSFASVYYTRKALLRFVDEQMQPGDLVAVIRTGGAVGALQQFTSDKTVLRTAINKIRWSPFSNIDALTSIGQTDSEISERFTSESDQLIYGKKTSTVIHPHDNIDEIQKQSRNASRNASTAAQSIYTQSSLGTLRYLVAGMKDLPGRKAMMLFSDGINIGDVNNNKSRAPVIFDFLQGVTDAANRSSVTIYTFDARGMQAMTIAASDSTYEIIDGHREQKVQQRTRDFREAQDGLAYLAEQTGGKALLNSNDINGGIDRALDEQAGYYLLGYVPDADTFEPGKRKFNKLEIKVNRPGLKVSYRSGFFNSETPDQTPQLDGDKAIARSLMSPFAENDITLSINALYANDSTSGAYIRSFLHIDARDLSFSEAADGWKMSTFDVAAVAFGNNGVPVDHIHTTYTIRSKGPTYDAMLKNGFVYVLMLPIKKAGVYQYRVALRDSSSGKIGTASQVVGVPDLTKQKLTMSSLAVENVSFPTWQLITQGKTGGSNGQTQLKSTLLYDTVLRQFTTNTVLRYGFEVYNAKPESGKGYHLETQASILQNDKVIVRGNFNKVDLTDASSAPRISGAITLGDKLPAGEYVLEIVVRDLVTKQETKQLFPFQIV